MFPTQSSRLIQLSSLLFLVICNCDGAPEPRNFLLPQDDQGVEVTTELPVFESVTSGEYILLEDDSGGDAIAQPSETNDIIASASSQSSSSSANSLASEKEKITQQANLLLLQQLQQQLKRQQQLQQPQQQQQSTNPQQFSLDGLVKSVVKMLVVAKTKIDQGARTFRDILQLFDRKKYVNIIPQNQASETNFIST